MSAERALQGAIYAALAGDGTYSGLVTGIYDGRAPQGTAYPYTTIGEITERDDGPISEDGWNLTVHLHDWSDYSGKKECQEIREARNALLHRQRLTVSGFGDVYIWQEFAEIFVDTLDADNEVRHGVSRYRAVAWPA